MKNILHKIRSLFKIGRLTGVDDSGDFQRGEFTYMGTPAVGQVFIPYGMMFHAVEGSQMAVFSQGAMSANPIALASDPKRRTLKDLKPGEVAIGNYTTGSYILFKEDGGIDVVCKKNLTVRVDGDEARSIAGDSVHSAENLNIRVDGNENHTVSGVQTHRATQTDFTRGVSVSGIQFLGHIHSQPSDSRGDSERDTSPPKNG